MPNHNKQKGTVGDQGQMRGDGGHGMGTYRKQNTGSVGHDSERNRGSMDQQQGMPQDAGRQQSEMGRSDEDNE